MSEITKEVLDAWMVVQSKATEQMVTVADRLTSVLSIEDKILEKQDKLIEKISNGICKEIKDHLTKELDRSSKNRTDELNKLNSKLSEVRDNMFWVKSLIGLLGIAIIMAEIILYFHK